jgi:hypothetical protein
MKINVDGNYYQCSSISGVLCRTYIIMSAINVINCRNCRNTYIENGRSYFSIRDQLVVFGVRIKRRYSDSANS